MKHRRREKIKNREISSLTSQRWRGDDENEKKKVETNSFDRESNDWARLSLKII